MRQSVVSRTFIETYFIVLNCIFYVLAEHVQICTWKCMDVRLHRSRISKGKIPDSSRAFRRNSKRIPTNSLIDDIARVVVSVAVNHSDSHARDTYISISFPASHMSDRLRQIVRLVPEGRIFRTLEYLLPN